MKKWLIIGGILFFVIISSCVAWNCTGQYRARHWGGTVAIDLLPGHKLETITWKDDEIWYLVRTMRPGEEPEEHVFHQQKTGLGRLEGKVVVKERAR